MPAGRLGHALGPALLGILLVAGVHLVAGAAAGKAVDEEPAHAPENADVHTTVQRSKSSPSAPSCSPTGTMTEAARQRLCRLVDTHRRLAGPTLWTGGVGGLEGVR